MSSNKKSMGKFKGQDAPNVKWVTDEELAKNTLKWKEQIKKEGGQLITQEYLDKLKAEEDKYYQETGKRKGLVSVATLLRDMKKKEKRVKAAKKLKTAKGGLIGPSYRHSNKDYRKGGLFK